MREFNIPYDQLKTIRETEPLKWEFWKSFINEEGVAKEKMIEKARKRKGRR